MKCISIREFYNQKLLGELSTGARPLTYQTILKHTRRHIEAGNDAGIVEIGEGKSVRYAIPVGKVYILKEWIEARYS